MSTAGLTASPVPDLLLLSSVMGLLVGWSSARGDGGEIDIHSLYCVDSKAGHRASSRDRPQGENTRWKDL